MTHISINQHDDSSKIIYNFKVYDDLIDHAGHKFGPDSNELKFALIQRDAQIHELLMNIQLNGLKNKVIFHYRKLINTTKILTFDNRLTW